MEFTCPNCGCTIPLPEIARFQTYEIRVASILNGECAPPFTPHYDVHNCATFPSLTFQVKYSELGYPRRNTIKGKTYQQQVWTWNAAKWSDDAPDYFVLCGIGSNALDETWFLVDRVTFKRFSSANGVGGRILQANNNRYQRSRGGTGRITGRLTRLFQYECKLEDVIEAVQKREAWRQDGLL
jgi:hypothetical protein